MVSFIPSQYLGRFVADNLDLSTFRNSLGPQRVIGERTFKDLRMSPSILSENKAEFSISDWYYEIKVVKRGDINGDGIEDLIVCFVDDAAKGSYLTSESILLTRYSESSLLVALRYDVDGC